MGPMTHPKDTAAAMECQAVSYAYEEGTLALESIDLTIRQGEFVALLASNGSGKTTLIKVMAGLLKPGKGHVRVNGEPIHTLIPESALPTGGPGTAKPQRPAVRGHGGR
jgi:ABC-type multidrug transport system ATPase subunit